MKINLSKIFSIYASVNHIRILQRQFDDASCFHSAQNLTKRIFLIKNIFYFHRIAIKNALSLSDYRTVGLVDRRTIGKSDHRSDPVRNGLRRITKKTWFYIKYIGRYFSAKRRLTYITLLVLITIEKKKQKKNKNSVDI